MTEGRADRWCLLIHNVPTQPLYLRARIRRLLEDAGAAPIRKAVYTRPASREALERFRAIAGEIEAAGGSAVVCEATFPDAATAEAVRRAYNDELTRRYRTWGAAVKRALSAPARVRRSQAVHGKGAGRRLARLRRQLEQIQAHDRFAAEGRERAEALLARAEALDARAERPGPMTGLRWVTRRGLHVDRIACAWVVRRFIDRNATFRFTANPAAPLATGEIGFDMPGADIAHHDGGCSMETLIERAGLTDARLRRVADIVHDIDLKDGRHRHPETAGFEQLLVGLIASTPADDDRLEQGLWLFDTLYAAGAGAAVPAARTAPRVRVPESLRRRGTR